MVSFYFTRADLDHKLVDFFGGPGLTIRDFGIPEDDYVAIDYADLEAANTNVVFTPRFVRKFGFCNFGAFIDMYVRCQLFNSYKLSTLTLREYLYQSYRKVAHENAPPPPESGCVLTYLKTYEPAWLMAIGW